MQKRRENPFVSGQFTFWKSQFPSKFVLHQKFKFAHLFYFKRGRKTSKTDVSFSSGGLWLSLSDDMKCTQLLLHHMDFRILLQAEAGEEPLLKD